MWTIYEIQFDGSVNETAAEIAEVLLNESSWECLIDSPNLVVHRWKHQVERPWYVQWIIQVKT